MNKKVKSNWMVEFSKKIKSQEKFHRVADQFSTYPEIQRKLEIIRREFSTEVYNLNKSDVIRGLIESFYDIAIEKEK